MKTKTSNQHYDYVTSFITLAVYAIFFFAVNDIFAQSRIYKVTQYHGLAAKLVTGEYSLDAGSEQLAGDTKNAALPTVSVTKAAHLKIGVYATVNDPRKLIEVKNTSVIGNIPTIGINGKVLFQESENSYRYLDGKKVGGDAKLVAYLNKGKPITEATYYFELKKAGYIKGISLWNFGKLSQQQKQLLISGDIACNN